MQFKKGVQLGADQKHLLRDHVSPSSDTVQLPKPSASPEQFDIFTPLFLIPFLPLLHKTVVFRACGLSFRIWGGEGRGWGVSERSVRGEMRRRSHSSHFLTEGDKNILAEWKTMDVRQVRGAELTAAVVCAES